MAIDVSYDRSIKNSTNNAVKRANINPTSASSTSKAATISQPTDSVTITDTARIMEQATRLAQNASDVDEAKVDAIAQQLREGKYTIDYSAIADSIMSA